MLGNKPKNMRPSLKKSADDTQEEAMKKMKKIKVNKKHFQRKEFKIDDIDFNYLE